MDPPQSPAIRANIMCTPVLRVHRGATRRFVGGVLKRTSSGHPMNLPSARHRRSRKVRNFPAYRRCSFTETAVSARPTFFRECASVSDRCIARQPDVHPRVRYVTGEEFTNEFITAVRRGELDAFRRRVRSLDLLAIDDVHFFSNKDKTQYEFMHTIDAIDLKGSRLVVASDEHPKLIRNFRQALVSRCLSGMVVEVQRPDRATRIRIIHRLAAARGLDFSDAAVQQLASHCVGSVRELEGAIIKVAAIQGLLGDNRGEVGMQVIDQLMNEADFQPKVPIRIASIVDSVCDRTGVDRQDLLSSSKRRDAVLGRGLVAYLARSMTNLSFPEIAREMGRAHHSTFHAADRRLATRIREEDVVTFGRDPRPILLRELVDQIRHDVQSRTGRPR